MLLDDFDSHIMVPSRHHMIMSLHHLVLLKVAVLFHTIMEPSNHHIIMSRHHSTADGNDDDSHIMVPSHHHTSCHFITVLLMVTMLILTFS